MYLPVSKGLFDIDTVAEDDAEPPDPVHSIVSVFSPMLSKDIDSVPEIDFAPLQSPLAEQAVELVDDQVTETASYMKAELGTIWFCKKRFTLDRWFLKMTISIKPFGEM